MEDYWGTAGGGDQEAAAPAQDAPEQAAPATSAPVNDNDIDMIE
jgi:THO complex subunit 4